ncbi:hypothetical protein D3C79_567400 [compost metagenome]
MACKAQGDILQRRAGKLVFEHSAPALDLEATVGRLQRRNLHALRLQPGQPGCIRAQPRPAAAAQRQHGGRRLERQFALWISDPQGSFGVPAQPAMAGVDNYSGVAQALEPGA